MLPNRVRMEHIKPWKNSKIIQKEKKGNEKKKWRHIILILSSNCLLFYSSLWQPYLLCWSLLFPHYVLLFPGFSVDLSISSGNLRACSTFWLIAYIDDTKHLCKISSPASISIWGLYENETEEIKSCEIISLSLVDLWR